MIIYGLDTCTLCQRARKTLESAGHDVTLRDLRAEPLSTAERDALIAEFGGALVDTTTNDWRMSSDWIKHSEVEEQLEANVKLMVRPVIRNGDALYLGWTDAVQSALLGE